MDGDGVSSLLEEDAMVADAQPKEPFKLAGQRLNAAGASFA